MRALLGSLRCCLNPKVIAVLAGLGAGLWWLSPGSAAAALPLLAVLVCPLSMGAMMWVMMRGRGAPAAADPGPSQAQLVEIGRLRAELDELRGTGPVPLDTSGLDRSG